MERRSPLDPPQMELQLGERRYALQPLTAGAAVLPNHRIPNKALLRIDEAAELLGISVNQVRNFLLDGTLRGKVINSQLDAARRHVRVLTSSVAEFLEDETRDT